MMVFKRKQIVVLSLVLMIVVAGYLQYSYRQSSISASKENGKLGESVYVDSDLNKDSKATSSISTDSKEAAKETSNTKASAAVSASKLANDFFAQAKLEREVSRERDKETLKTISVDNAASKEAKAKAYEKVMKIVDNSQKESRLETLIKEKGFNDVVALFGDDGGVDIVVKAPTLTSAHTAQICDIVSRQANIPITKITIKNIF